VQGGLLDRDLVGCFDYRGERHVVHDQGAKLGVWIEGLNPIDGFLSFSVRSSANVDVCVMLSEAGSSVEASALFVRLAQNGNSICKILTSRQ
jgi:hypothetical protein